MPKSTFASVSPKLRDTALFRGNALFLHGCDGRDGQRDIGPHISIQPRAPKNFNRALPGLGLEALA